MGNERAPFKRINFFKGFATTANDWNEAEDYHHRKRELHNRYLHAPGVVPDYLDELRVTAVNKGKGVTVSAGCAIDGRGRELLLPDEQDIALVDIRPVTTVFVILEHHFEKELPAHHFSDLNREYEGYKFWEETSKIAITELEPADDDGVELARIKVGKSSVVIRDATDPENPKENEIDLRYVKRAGALTRQVRRTDFLEQVDKDYISVPVSKEQFIISDNDPEIPLELGVSADELRFYIVKAYPEGTQAWITWNIVRKRRDDAIDYFLYFKNQGKEPSKVEYEIYRVID